MGMLNTIYERFPEIAKEADKAFTAALQNDPDTDTETVKRIWYLLRHNGETQPEDVIDIHRTSVAQLAILMSSVLTLKCAAERLRGKEVCAIMGHSLGQISALVAAGVISFTDGIRIVRERGLAMEEAVQDGGRLGVCERQDTGMGMVAVPVLSKNGSSHEMARMIEATAKQAIEANEVVAVANINSPKQIVVSGHLDAIERTLQAMAPAVRRSTRLPVRIPFHSPLLRSVEARMRRVVETVDYKWPPPNYVGVSIIRNDTARAIGDVAEVKEAIVQGCWLPVDWQGSVRYAEEEYSGPEWIGVGSGCSVTGALVKASLARDCPLLTLDPAKGGEGWSSL